jgi:hypothetical protein
VCARGHKRTTLGLFGGALIIAGIFTFAPGRVMHRSSSAADDLPLPALRRPFRSCNNAGRGAATDTALEPIAAPRRHRKSRAKKPSGSALGALKNTLKLLYFKLSSAASFALLEPLRYQRFAASHSSGFGTFSGSHQSPKRAPLNDMQP